MEKMGVKSSSGLNWCSCLMVVFLLPVLLCTSQDTFKSSQATFNGNRDCLGSPTGACGYGELGRNYSDGDVTAVSALLYRDGTGCGACYQVRCTIAKLCTADGVKLVVTDQGGGGRIDFVLSLRGFTRLALPNKILDLMAYGVVDIEYRRISCQYSGHNLAFKVIEHSRYPNYLAILILYQAGYKDITAVELWQADQKQWLAMRHSYGAVWDIANPPMGALDLRFQVNGAEYIQVKNAIPSDWKAGVIYETAIQI